MRAIVEGGAVASMHDVYDALAAALGLPESFGRNLDALWDVLTTDVPGPVELVWRDADVSRVRLGAAYVQLAKLLEAVARARPDFRVRFE